MTLRDQSAPSAEESAIHAAHRAIAGLGAAAEVIEDSRDDSARWVARTLRVIESVARVILSEATVSRVRT